MPVDAVHHKFLLLTTRRNYDSAKMGCRSLLSNKQIADGINAARRNARRLAEDAQILLEAYRYPTAASLAILSVEESGKEHIIRGMARATTGAEVLQHWKDYRSHTKKNIMWLLPQLVMELDK